MPNTKGHDTIFNESGFKDLTAFEALNNIQREERKKIIEELKSLAKRRGYRIVGMIKLKALKDDELESDENGNCKSTIFNKQSCN